MNWAHLEAIIWLRWRLATNHIKRAGALNAVLTTVFIATAIIVSVCLFFTTLIVGVKVLPHATADHILFLWDGIVLAFLITWTLGMITELQRSDALSLDKLMHLPVSLKGAFLCNYLSSFASVSIVVFLPAMIGLSIALQSVKGNAMFMLFPMIAGFLLMVSALTYQFRGWLATLMVNKRRRNTIIASMTLGLIVFFQIPNFINIAYQRTRGDATEAQEQRKTELARLTGQLNAEQITKQQYATALDQVRRTYTLNQNLSERRARQRFNNATTLGNVLLPIGWLPYGARAAFDGQPGPAALATLGMFVIAIISLRRSYATTIRYFQSGFQTDQPKSQVQETETAFVRRRKRVLLVERSLPGCSQRTSAITFASLRALIRAPEAKMILLTPLIILVVFGAMIFSSTQDRINADFRPMMALGAIGMAMFSILQLIQNQFGLDRDGFRNYVLTPASRKEILLGKNLGIAPIALGIGVIALVALQIATPLKPSHLAASFLQLATIYLIFCMMGNQVSILLPIRMASGSMRPAHNKPTVFFTQLLLLISFPFALLPTWIPIALDLYVTRSNWNPGIPIYLLLSALELAVMLGVYHWALTRQGSLLQSREKRILQIVTAAD